jgi:hypothetical protein
VSRSGTTDRDFYAVFDSVDDCVLATFDEGLARVTGLVIEAARCEHGLHARIEAVLSALLVFLDEESGWARLLIAESPVANSAVNERRRKALAALTRALVNETQAEANSSGWFVPALEVTAELVVGGVASVLRTRMLEGVREPFAALASSLNAFVTAPYQWAGPDVEAKQVRETDKPEWRAQRLPIRTTYRTTRVLSAIGDSPGLSNRAIAETAGLADEGQTSKLLRRLEQRGLVRNFGLGQAHGGANAWQLSPYGERVLEASRHSLVPGAGAVMGRRVRGAA